ncbi:TPA: hypothetical protein HA225_04820 [Candidatus Micrarchaeota archaeon]|nr:hypothetical protein [Candidatus Micrarchaeota archaeon]HIH30132.1 hypothetical protein [Candidatus Micrarchaeota archaeon]
MNRLFAFLAAAALMLSFGCTQETPPSQPPDGEEMPPGPPDNSTIGTADSELSPTPPENPEQPQLPPSSNRGEPPPPQPV